MAKPQRIRDPVHNLIEFDAEQFEHTLWQVIQTAPYQRLRRIKQLGFSELVFPGATHSRFAHSLGVFHIARLLMQVIRQHLKTAGRQFGEHQAQVALAAALLHDVGHGMFSHAFEAIGKEFGLSMAHHEHVSAKFITETEIADTLMPLGNSFAEEVAKLVGQKGPGNLYDAVVSSQFDADRLDYMQRDRLMTGVRSSGVDQTWLIANLEVHPVPTGADDSAGDTIETLILGPKASQTAESYLLSLFHLYPNVYLHKTTRGAEQLFVALMRRLNRLERDGHSENSGLPANHPIRRFLREPDKVGHALNLDDTVFWGALPLMGDSADAELVRLTAALRSRNLLRCIDLRQRIEAEMPRRKRDTDEKHRGRVAQAVDQVARTLDARAKEDGNAPHPVLIDRYDRSPYKRYQDSDTPLNRVLIRSASSGLQDMAEHSAVIAAARPFEICRAYIFRGDSAAEKMVENEMRTAMLGRRS